MRSDAHRNLTALLSAAKDVFASDGVDAPAKQITDRAGVGVGTLYRHFPRRSDLIAAVLQQEIDACIDAAGELGGARDPGEAVEAWIDRYSALVATKQGLAGALHSGDPAYEGLTERLAGQLEAPLQALLDRAEEAGALRTGVTAREVITGVSLLWHPVPGRPPTFNDALVRIFVAGLRCTRSSSGQS